MKKHLLKFSLIAGFFTASVFHVTGQSILYVTNTSGAISQFNLTDIKNITHAANAMVITKNDGSSVNFPLSTLKRYTFKQVVTAAADEALEDKNATFNVFPNPGNGKFNIAYRLKSADAVQFKLFTQDGSLVKSQTDEHNDAGSYVKTFETTGLQGIYILQITTSSQTSTQKIIINP